jgi:hypothetical protein
MKNGHDCNKGIGQSKSTGQSKVSLCSVKTRAERNTEYTKERECYIRLHQHINRMLHGKKIKKAKKKK